MASELGSFVVNIKAQIEGYQSQIAKIKQELAKVGKDTDIGKEIANSLKTAETQVARLGKTMEKRISSESQILALKDSLQGIDRMFMDIGDAISRVTWDDLNTDKLKSDLTEAQGQVNKLTNDITTNFSNGMKEAIKSSDDLKKVFDELKIDPDKMKVGDIGRKLSEHLKEASSAADSAQEALSKAQEKAQQAANAVGNLNQKLFEVQSAGDSIQGAFKELQTVTNTSINAENLTAFKERATAALDGLSDSVKTAKADVVENLRNMISQLNSDLSIDELQQKIGQLNTAFNSLKQGSLSSNTGFANINKLQEFLSVKDTKYSADELLDLATQLEEVFKRFNNLGLNDAARDSLIDRLLNSEGAVASVDAVKQTVISAIQNYVKAIKDEKAKADKELRSATGAEEAARTKATETNEAKAIAEAASSKFTTEIASLKAKNQELAGQVKSLESQIKQLKTQIDARAQRNRNPLAGAGGNIKNTSEQALLSAEKAAARYSAQLEQVKAKEQLVGNIQSFVQRWFSVYAAARMVSKAFNSMKTTLKELDDIMTQIAIVTDKTQGDLWAQMPQYSAMAKEYATSIKGVYQVSQLYYQQGLEQNDVMSLTEQTLKMAKISGLEYATATDYMTNAVRSFKMEMTDAQKVVDVYSELAASSATSTAELATAMSKTASSAQSVGSSFENTSAMMAVMIEATRESAENIGSALKSIISRYGEMKTNPAKLIDSEGEVLSLNKVDTALQSVGISLHDTKGQFRDFDDVIMELSKSWDSIDKNTQRYIATIMAGNRQQSRFLALVSNGERLEELTEKAANAEDTATLQVLKTMDSISAKAQQLQTSLQGLYTEGGFENIYKNILGLSKNIIDSFNDMPKMFNSIPVTAIATFSQLFINIGGLVTNGLAMLKERFTETKNKLSQDLPDGVKDASNKVEDGVNSFNNQLDKIGQKADETKSRVGNIGNALDNAQKQNPDVTARTSQPIDMSSIAWWQASRKDMAKQYNEAIAGGRQAEADAIRAYMQQKGFNQKTNMFDSTLMQRNAQGVGQASRAIGASLQIISMAMDKTTDSGKQIAASLNLAGGALSTFGYAMTGNWVLAATTAVTTVVKAFDDFNETVQEKIQRFNKNISDTSNTALQSKDELKTLADYKAKYDELFKLRNRDADSRQQWIELNNEISQQYPQFISYIDEEGNKIVSLAENYDALYQAKAGVYEADNLKNLVAQIEALSDVDYIMQDLMNATANIKTNDRKFSLFGIETILGSLDAKDATAAEKWLGNFNKLLTQAGGDFTKFKQLFSEAYNMDFDSMASGLAGGNLTFNVANKNILGMGEEHNMDLSVSMAIGSYLQQIESNWDLYNNQLLNFIQSENQELANYFGKKKNYEYTNYAVTADAVTEELNAYWERDLKNARELAVQNGQELDLTQVYTNFYANMPNYIAEINERIFSDLDFSENNEALAKADEIFKNSDLFSFDYLTNLPEEILEILHPEQIVEIQKAAEKRLQKANERIESIISAAMSEGDLPDNLIFQGSTISDAFGEMLTGVAGQYYDSYIDQLYSIINSTNYETDAKETALQNFADFRDTLVNDNNLNENQINQIDTILSSADLTSLTGVYDLQTQLQSLNFISSDIDFSFLTDNIIPNLITEYNNMMDKIVASSEDVSKAISKASKGMELKDATELATKLGLNLADFDFINGKYFFKDAEAIQQAYTKYNEGLLENLNEERVIAESLLNKTSEKSGQNILNEMYDAREALDQLSEDTQLTTIMSTIGVSEKEAKKILNYYNSYKQAYENRSEEQQDLTFNEFVLQQIANAADDVESATQDWLKYQTNEALLQAGKITDFLENVLGDTWTNMEVPDKVKLLEQITSGDLESVLTEHPELAEYASTLMSVYKDIASNINSQLTSSINNGAQYIEKTDLNAPILRSLGDLATEVKDVNGEIIGYFVEVTKENVNEYIKWLQDNKDNLTTSDIKSSIKAAHELKFPNLSNAMTGMFEDSISIDSMIAFAEAVDGDITDIEGFAAEYGYTIDTLTGNFVRGAETIEKLQAKLVELKATPGADKKSINAIESQIEQAKQKPTIDLSNAVKEVMSNKDAITSTMVENLANSLQIDFNNLLTSGVFTDNGNGTYRINFGRLREIVDGLNNDFTEEYYKNLSLVIDAIQNEITDATSMVTEGAKSQESAQSFIEAYNQLTGENASFDQLYSWDSEFNSWKLSVEAYNKYRQALLDTAINAGASDEVVAGMLEASTDELRNAIDVSSFLNAANKQGKARKKLADQIKKYRESAKLSTDDTTIEQIIKNLEQGGESAVTTLKQLHPEATEEELKQAYETNITDYKNALNSLKDGISKGSFVENDKLRSALEAADYEIDSDGIVTSTGNLLQAYQNIYIGLKSQTNKTTSDLNAAYADVLTATQMASATLIDNIKNGLGMSFDDISKKLININQYRKEKGLAEIKLEDIAGDTSKYGVEMTSTGFMIKDLDTWLSEIYGESVEELKAENPDEYTSALSEYNEALIAYNKKVGDQIKTEFSNLSSANIGDQINVTYLVDKLGQDVVEKLLGTTVDSNGIVTATKDTATKAISIMQQAIENDGSIEGIDLEGLDLNTIWDSYIEVIKSVQSELSSASVGDRLSKQTSALLAASGKFSTDETGTVILRTVTDYINAADVVFEDVQQAFNKGKASLSEFNTAAMLRDQSRVAGKRAASTAAKELLEQQSEITEESIKNLADSLGVAYDEIKGLFTLQSNGYYKVNTAGILEKMAEVGASVEEFVIKAFDQALNAIQGNYDLMSTGFSDVESIMKDYKDLKSTPGFENVKFDEIYEYNESLNTFVLSANGLIVKNQAAIAKINQTYEDGIAAIQAGRTQLDNADAKIRAAATSALGNPFAFTEEGMGSDLFARFQTFKDNSVKEYTDDFAAWEEFKQSEITRLNEEEANLEQGQEITDSISAGTAQQKYNEIDFSGIATGVLSYEKARASLVSYLEATGIEDAEILEHRAKEMYDLYSGGGKAAFEDYARNSGKNYNAETAKTILEGTSGAAQELFDAIMESSDDAIIVLTDAQKEIFGIAKEAPAYLKAGDFKKIPSLWQQIWLALENGIETGATTIEQLNNNISKELATSDTSKIQSSEEALKSAMSNLTNESLASLATALELQLNEGLNFDELGEENGVTTLKDGSKIITNVHKFFDWLKENTDTATQEFFETNREKIESAIQTSTTSANVDTLISSLTEMSTGLNNEINNLISAKSGDLVNISYLVSQYMSQEGLSADDAVAQLAADLNVTEDEVRQGYITITDDISTGIWAIISTLLNRNYLPDNVATQTEGLKTSEIQSAISNMNSLQIGSVLDTNLTKTLISLGSQLSTNENGEAVIQTAQEYVDTINLLYSNAQQLFASHIIDLATLNDSFAQVIKANNSKDSAVDSMLSSASNLSTDMFSSFATAMGLQLESIIDSTGEIISTFGDSVQRTGTDSYKVTNWDAYIADLEAVLGHSLDQYSQDYINSYISWLESEANEAPNAKEALMTSLVDHLETLSYAEIGQIAKTFDMTVDQVLAMVENNGDNTFNGRDLLTSLSSEFDADNEQVKRAIADHYTAIATAMSDAAMSYIEAGQDGTWASGDDESLRRAVVDYNKAVSEEKQISYEGLRDLLQQGKEAALYAAQAFLQEGEQLSTEQVDSIYHNAVNRWVDAIETVLAKPGDIVDATTAEIINAAGGAASEIANSGSYVVESVANLYEAYNYVLQQLEASGNATLSQLNQTAALALANKAVGESSASEKYVIEALGDAANMTYERFGELLTERGIRLTEDLVDAWESQGLLQKLGPDSIAITDFSTFAGIMGWEANSAEYLSAFSAYNDALIELNKSAEEAIESEVNSLMGAQAGDWINLTQLFSKLDSAMSKIFEERYFSDFNYTGNVDISKRPIISPEQMQAAGYTDFDGDYATLYSTTFSFGDAVNDLANCLDIIATPIQDASTVLSDSELDDYIWHLVESTDGSVEAIKAADAAQRNLILGMFEGEDVLSEANKEYGEKLHEFSEDWVNLDIDPAAILQATFEQLGAKLENGILKINDEGANIPAILTTYADWITQYGDLSAQETAVLLDSIQDALKSYTDLLSNAVNGSLNNQGAKQLQDWATNLGIGELKFTETEKGLKLATDQAFKLADALKDVDSMQGKLAFDSIVDALTADKGSGFETISGTMAKIANAQKEIKKNEEEINALREQGSTNTGRIDQLNAENNKLREQIGLYERIAQRQSIDPSRYNFMDQDLPTSMQGPINYWDSVGKAFSAMNEASSTGRMAIQDFYNIVTEMNNLIALSGEQIELAGVTLDGSAEAAAALIEKGMGSLTNIDGKGVKVNLENLGIDFASGAEGAKENFADGVHALAESQIAMLDAAIKVLEIVVAMEALGNIDVEGNNNGHIDIGEIFGPDLSIEDGFDQKYSDACDALLKKAEYDEDLKNALNDVKINGHSMYEMLDAARGTIDEQKEKFAALNMSEEQYAAVIDAFYQAMLNGDYNLDTIQDSVWEILDQLMPDGTTIDIGDRTLLISGGTHTMINWKSQQTQEALAVFKTTEEEAKKKLIEAIQHYTTGESTTTEVEAVLRMKGIIKADTENGGVLINGKHFDNVSDSAAQEAMAEAVMEDKKIGNIDVKYDEELGVVTGTGTVKIGDTVIVASYNDGKVTYHSDRTGGDYGSLMELQDAEVKQWQDEIQQQTGKRPSVGEAIEALYNIPYKPRAEVISNLKDGETAQKAREVLSQDREKIINEVKEAATASASDRFTYEVSKDGTKITFNFDGVEVTTDNTGNLQNDVNTALDKVADQLTYDDGITQIAEGIKAAFSGDNSIGEAIAEGIAAALSNYTITIDPTTGKIEVKPIDGAVGEAVENEPLSPIEKFIDNLIAKATGKDTEAEGVPEAAQEAVDKVDIAIPTADATITQLNVKKVDHAQMDQGILGALFGINTNKITIPSAPGVLQKLNITKVESTALGTGNAAVDAIGSALGTNTLTIPSANATLTKLIITKAETTDFSSVESEGASEANNLTIPAAKAVLSQLTITKAEQTDFSAVEDNADVSDMTIDAASATISSLSVSADNIDVDSVGKQIVDALQAYLDGNQVTPSVGAGQSSGEGTDTSGLSGLSSAFTEIGTAGTTAASNIVNALNAITTDKVDAIQTSQDAITTDKVDAIQTSQDAITTDKVDAIQTSQDAITTDKVDAIQSAQDSITTDKVDAVKSVIESISNDAPTTVKSTIEGISNDAPSTVKSTLEGISNDAASKVKGTLEGISDDAASKVKGTLEGISNDAASKVKGTLEGISDSAASSVKSKLESISVSIPSSESTSVTLKYSTRKTTSAKGNVALAKGKKALAGGTTQTLMGELGPELVVSNGSYYLVGENGAEFVDLENDAIVFNHLQTQRLLNNGAIGGRGKAFTNERNAVSLAKGRIPSYGPAHEETGTGDQGSDTGKTTTETISSVSVDPSSHSFTGVKFTSKAKGNILGPAMASASAALAALKRLRAMWQSLLDASLADMGGNTGGSCFAAGTLVSTINGFKKIEDIEKGDIVLSYNEDTEQNEYSEVLQTMIHFTKEKIYTLHIKDEDLVVTGIHRFLITRGKERGWIAAANLQSGDSVLFANGNWYPISYINVEEKTLTVYNFEVSNNHNYYVGSNQVLAHNKGGGCFAAGTQIKMQGYYKNIEDIQIGDIVLSYNENTGKNEYSKVLQTMIHDVDEEIYTLSIEDEQLVVTGIHRFLIDRSGEREWIAAAALKIGDNVLFADGTLHSINNIEVEDKILRVYNFEVSNNHNYYVGKNSILAHNKGGSNDETDEAVDGIVSNVERWYNWLALIEEKQNKINLLTKEYDLLTARHASSAELADNLKQQAENLKIQLDTARQLVIEQKAYRKTLAKKMNGGMFGAFYQVDEETGQIRLNNDKAFADFVGKNYEDKYKRKYKNEEEIPDYLKQYYKKNKAGEWVAQDKNAIQSAIEKHNNALKSKIKNGKIGKGYKFTRTYSSDEIAALQEKEVKDTYKKGKVPDYLKDYYEEKDGKMQLKSGKEKAAKKAVMQHYAGKTKTFTLDNDITSGLDFIEELNRTDTAGNAVHSAAEQLAMIKELGFFTEDLMTGVDTSQSGWEATVVQNFLDKIENDKAEMEALNDSIQEQQEAMLEYQKAIQEINNQYHEMARPVEAVTDHLEEWYEWTRKIATEQSKLNLLTKQYTGLTNRRGDNTAQQVENLKQQAEKARQMRDNTQNTLDEMAEKRKEWNDKLKAKSMTQAQADARNAENAKINEKNEKLNSERTALIAAKLEKNKAHNDQATKDKSKASSEIAKKQAAENIDWNKKRTQKWNNISNKNKAAFTTKGKLKKELKSEDELKAFKKLTPEQKKYYEEVKEGNKVVGYKLKGKKEEDVKKLKKQVTDKDITALNKTNKAWNKAKNTTYKKLSDIKDKKARNAYEKINGKYQLKDTMTEADWKKIGSAQEYYEKTKKNGKTVYKLKTDKKADYVVGQLSTDTDDIQKQLADEWNKKKNKVKKEKGAELTSLNGLTDEQKKYYQKNKKTGKYEIKANRTAEDYRNDLATNLKTDFAAGDAQEFKSQNGRNIWYDFDEDGNLIYNKSGFGKYLQDNALSEDAKNGKFKVTKISEKVSKQDGSYLRLVNGKERNKTWRDKQLTDLGLSADIDTEAFTKLKSEISKKDLKSIAPEFKSLYEEVRDDKGKLTGYKLKKAAQKAQTNVNDYDNGVNILDTQEVDADLSAWINDPEKFFQKLTATDAYGNAVYDGRQQMEILEQMGLGDTMAAMGQYASWETMSEEERIQAAKDYLEYVKQTPEEYNKLLDEINKNKEQLEEYKNQVAEINNQIRELLKPVDGVTEHLEAWYEWTRKTATAQNALNKLTAQYSNLQKQLGDTTSKQVKNLKAQAEQIQKQITANKEEIKERKAELKEEKNKVAKGPMNKLFNFDEEGNLVYSTSALSDVKGTTSIEVLDYGTDAAGNKVEKKTINGAGMTYDEFLKYKNYDAATDEEKEAIQTEWDIATLATTQQTVNLDKIFAKVSSEGITPEEFIKVLTATDANGKANLSLQEQRAALEQAGFSDAMAEYYGQGSWDELNASQRNEAAKAYLEYISQYPEKINQLTDELAAAEVEGINLEGQMLEINNSIREMLKTTPGVTDHLEKWYKWTRQTTDAQKALNKYAAEYSNLDKKIGNNTKDKAKNLTNQSKELQKQLEANKEEVTLRKQDLADKTAALTDSRTSNPLSHFFTLDKNNNVVYRNAAFASNWSGKTTKYEKIARDNNGHEIRTDTTGKELQYGTAEYEKGLVKTVSESINLSQFNGMKIEDFINTLTGTDKLGNANYSLEEQTAIIGAASTFREQLGDFNNQHFFDSWDEATSEERKAAVQAFLEYAAQYPEEMNNLKDAIADAETEGINLEGKILDINNQLKELATVAAGIQSPFDKWYTWLQKIAQEQNKLNILTKKYNNLQNTRTANGKTQAKNLLEQLDLLDNQSTTNKQYKSARQKELNSLVGYTKSDGTFVKGQLQKNNALSKFFTYDKDSGLQYNTQAFEEQTLNRNGIVITGTGDNGVYTYRGTKDFTFSAKNTEDFIKKLTQQNADNSMKYNVEQQFEILRAFGFEDLMKYDSSGNELFANGIDNATKEEIQNAVSALLNNLKGFQDDVKTETDEIQSLAENQLDIEGSIIDIKNQLQDNEISLENAVMEAIETREQNKIDTLKEEKDIISDAADRFIDNLTTQLNKEKEMYERTTAKDELATLQRQLAILQRSGGSASQIRSLQNQIKSQQKDIYFDERQAQIDAIKEASDKQIEKLDRQIEIMEDTLTYNKENGLYWNEVRSIMSKSYSQILAFLTENSAELKEQSSLQGSLTLAENGTLVGQWVGTRNKVYANGGLIDFTGPAWVDGSGTKPEGILNADQTNFLRHELIDSLESFSLAINQFTQGALNNSILNTLDNNSGINIDQLHFEMNVESIANDYDAKRAGQQAFEEMVRIARKSGNRSISRR